MLGVSREAPPESVRETFRRLAREYHADRFSRYDLPDTVHQLIQLTFVTINASNEILGEKKTTRLRFGAEPRESGFQYFWQSFRGGTAELDKAFKAERELEAAQQFLTRGEVKGAKSRLQKASDLGFSADILSVLQVT